MAGLPGRSQKFLNLAGKSLASFLALQKSKHVCLRLIASETRSKMGNYQVLNLQLVITSLLSRQQLKPHSSVVQTLRYPSTTEA